MDVVRKREPELERLAVPEVSLIVSRRPCILAAADIRKWEKQAMEGQKLNPCAACG